MNAKELTGPGFCESFAGEKMVCAGDVILEKFMARLEKKDGKMEKAIGCGICGAAIFYLLAGIFRVS